MLNKINKTMLGVAMLGSVAFSGNAMADRDFNTAAGAVIGASIGAHSGGSGGAIAGGVIGAVVGNSLSGGRGHDRGGYYETRVYEPAPRYYAPAPVYYAPAPRYYAPPPAVVYVEPRRGYSRTYYERHDRGGYYREDYRGHDRGSRDHGRGWDRDGR
jgi:hypothetical protein